ncbi:MAG: hypothetical protein COA94_07845 [Rickettsiales bacterium]|nr:MAG: hypothetical protein COA94_07845 [Rickettsiales bacterium]
MSDEIKEYLEPGKKNLILIYMLYLCGVLVPLLPIVGGVFAYANQNNEDEIWKSHYIFAFRSAVLGVLGMLISMITAFIFIGVIFYMVVVIWFVVRSILALQYLFEGKAHPNPMSYWIK